MMGESVMMGRCGRILGGVGCTTWLLLSKLQDHVSLSIHIHNMATTEHDIPTNTVIQKYQPFKRLR